jgi:hypothetical protein
MKSISSPREYKVFNIAKNRFYKEEELIADDVYINNLGEIYNDLGEDSENLVLCWWSGQFDVNKVKIYEGDICKMLLGNEFGSYTEQIGIMKWNVATSQFILMMKANIGNDLIGVDKVEVIGHEFTDKELLAKLIN